MIGQLTGLVGQIEGERCIVDVNGVGYVVSASTRTLASVPMPPSVARFLIETVVREDAILLYGFATTEEQEWFRLLTTVQGVGAKVALAILSSNAPGDLFLAINAGDRGSLTRAAGVGPRLADRILSELKNKIAKMPVGAATIAASGGVVTPAAETGLEGDALLALAGLGFRRAEAWPVVKKVLAEHDGASLDLVIRLSLKDLAR
ncbi:Holliday junction branch migration protein RuvA [Neokomagataea anthophila]|uniref:Holliday junction branch migration complex subunit RuvA n=1 Tax=Neokomagataea anthophila TaxID=2826925 RepID=A0ABS5E600_9PROT|nr:Holliday junction branch migration protein RuvA [uncultured Neokomagataea sp.]MBR0559338.1 Holliday junction branch migration protein RuvA [Neokomagataea anthophila]